MEKSGYRYTVIKPTPFKEYIIDRYGSFSTFNMLKFSDKEKIFLRWKYGFTNEDTNRNLEMTDRLLCSQYKDKNLDEVKNEGMRFHMKQKIWYENYCYETKMEIGLLQKKTPITEQVQGIADKFGGSIEPF